MQRPDFLRALLPTVIIGLIFWFLVVPLPLSESWVRGPRAGPLGFIVLMLWAGLGFMFLRLTGPFRRRLRFRADGIVSREFGMRNELLESLRKIDSMSIVDGRRLEVQTHSTRFSRETRSEIVRSSIGTVVVNSPVDHMECKTVLLNRNTQSTSSLPANWILSGIKAVPLGGLRSRRFFRALL